MKRNIFWTIVLVLIFLLMLAGEAYTVVAVISLDMLPEAYLAVLIGVLALFSLIVGLMLFVKGKGKARRIIACVLAVVVACGCGAIATVANDEMKTLKATTSQWLEIPTREIYVLADNTVQELEHTGGFTYGYLKDYDESCTGQVLNTICQRTGTQVPTAGYLNIVTMVNALLENRIDAIILNGGIISLLEETDEFADFSSRVRVLDQIRVEETEETENLNIPAQEQTNPTNRETEPAVPDETLTQEIVEYTALEPFAVYVSGSDSRDTTIVKNGRSDVNILAIVNPMTKQVLLVNTPRDCYVANTAAGGALDKLTHCGIYGTKCSMNTLGNLYDTDIDYFVRINFTGFKKLIDALGGVTVYSDYAFTAITRTEIQEGENHLDGQQALDFARERATLKGGDNERGKHQMQVITAVIEKATSGTTIISNYTDIMASVEGMFQTNIATEMISDLMKMQLSDMARWNVVSFAVTGAGSMEECYSMPGMLLSVMKPNRTSVSKASRLIDMVLEGELLTEEVMSSIS